MGIWTSLTWYCSNCEQPWNEPSIIVIIRLAVLFERSETITRYLIRIQIFWYVILCSWMSGYRRFEGSICPCVQVSRCPINFGPLDPWRYMHYVFVETSIITHPTTQYHNVVDMNPGGEKVRVFILNLWTTALHRSCTTCKTSTAFVCRSSDVFIRHHHHHRHQRQRQTTTTATRSTWRATFLDTCLVVKIFVSLQINFL